MSACTKIKSVLRMGLCRAVLTPATAVMVAPIVFVLTPGSCADSRREAMEIIRFMWKGMEL